jgi:hypothetical protein
MTRTQSITQTKTELPVMQGAYAWCCAALNGAVLEKKANPREQLCTVEQYNFTLSGPVCVLLVSPLKSEFLADSASENWLKFQNLVKQWRDERGARSSITETVMIPAYQKIIGMGETALPLILAQLRSEGDEPDQWFWALRAITEANPIKPEDQGNFQKMAQAWLQWAENGVYAW